MKNTNWNDYKEFLNKGYVLVDIREEFETAQGYVNNAKLIPLSTIKNLSFFQNNKTLIYCASGNRSRNFVSTLIDNGINQNNAINVEGGYNAYKFFK